MYASFIFCPFSLNNIQILQLSMFSPRGGGGGGGMGGGDYPQELDFFKFGVFFPTHKSQMCIINTYKGCLGNLGIKLSNIDMILSFF